MAGSVSIDAQDPNGNPTHVKAALSGAMQTCGALEDLTLATLTAASVGANSADQSGSGGRGIKLVIDITAISGTTPTLTVTLQGKDAASGKYYTILASAALNSTGTTVLTVYPGLTAAANTAANDVLPNIWRVSYAIGGTGPSVTATIGASVL